MTKADFEEWIYEALRYHGGQARLIDIARRIWERHEMDLRASDGLFFTWQRDLRRAIDRLWQAGKLLWIGDAPQGMVALAR